MEAYAWGLQRHSSSLISDNDHAYVALHLYSTTIVKLTFFQDLLGGPSIIDFTSTACTFPFSLAHKGNQFQVLILNQSCSWSCILTSAQNRYYVSTTFSSSFLYVEIKFVFWILLWGSFEDLDGFLQYLKVQLST